jgi:hypothetical protein
MRSLRSDIEEAEFGQ